MQPRLAPHDDHEGLPAEWRAALERHAAATRSYGATASGVAAGAWTAPVGPGKWTPAEITEHLNLTYDVAMPQLNGEAGIRVRTNWLLRVILRATALRWIFRNRALPRGAKAPREVKPEHVADTQSEATERFARLAREFDALVSTRWQDGSVRLTHHIFGAIDLLAAIDFIAIHIEHHHRQIASDPTDAQ